MKSFYQSIVTTIVLLSVPLVIQARPLENKAPGSAKPLVSLFPISMISVLTNPDQYRGKRCRIQGFLHLQFEDNRLYFSKEFADYLSSENSIYVSLDENVHLEPSVRFSTIANAYGKLVPQYFHEKVVMLEGTFDDTLRLHVSRILESDHYKDLK